MVMRFIPLGALALLVTAACGGSVGGGGGPCAGDNPPPECTATCTTDDQCQSGFHCGTDGICTAECTAGGNECGPSATCDSRGRCQPNPSGGDGGLGTDADCPSVVLDLEPKTPTVQLLLDQSGSMTADFGAGQNPPSRYEAMQAALVGANGVVTTLEDKVIFGASLYTSHDGAGAGRVCPIVTSNAGGRALNQKGEIAALLSAGPDDETPTGESIDAVLADFRANPAPAGSKPIILLATDGEPDTCAQPNPQNGQALAIAAAKRAHSAGIDLFILAVGDEVSAQHQQDMANAGVGLATGVAPGPPGPTRAPVYQADNPAELATALNQIIGGVLSCDLDLDGQIQQGRASEGVVTLNGRRLTFGTEWEQVDADTIRLLGASCDELQSAANPQVSGEFPCGSVIPDPG